MRDGCRPYRTVAIRGFGVGTGVSKQAKRNARHLNRELYAQALAIVADGLVECMLADETCKGRLEIAHTRQDGVEDRMKWGSHRQFYRAVIVGEREISDLTVFCASHHQRFDWMKKQIQ